MKKTLLLMIAAFLIISAMGLSVNEKTQINVYQKQQNSENFQGSLSKGEKLDSTITDTWDQPGSQWVFLTRKKYSYTVNGFTTTSISSIRDITTSFIWVNSDKDETTVNANGNTTLDISYDWNIITSQWVPSFKMEFTFDGSGNMTSNSSYTWNGSAWVGLVKTEYTYTGGKLTLTIGYSWNSGTSAWVTSKKTEYTYDGNGNQTLDISYNWSGSQWVNSSKTEHTYTGGKKTLDITFNWNVSGSSWDNFRKTEYTYDVNGNQILNITYSWDGSQWVNSTKTETTYTGGKISMFIVSNWIGGQWVGILKNEFTYGVSNGSNYTITISSLWVINQWVNTSRSTSWYSSGTTDINKFLEKNIRIYPNPAKEFIVFDLTDISESAIAEIFDIQGKKVLEQRLSDYRQISVSNLPKGLYIYKLNNGGIIYTGKLLKE